MLPIIIRPPKKDKYAATRKMPASLARYPGSSSAIPRSRFSTPILTSETCNIWGTLTNSNPSATSMQPEIVVRT